MFTARGTYLQSLEGNQRQQREPILFWVDFPCLMTQKETPSWYWGVLLVYDSFRKHCQPMWQNPLTCVYYASLSNYKIIVSLKLSNIDSVVLSSFTPLLDLSLSSPVKAISECPPFPSSCHLSPDSILLDSKSTGNKKERNMYLKKLFPL